MLYMYVVHTQRLTQRQARLHGTMQAIRQALQEENIGCKITMVLKPDAGDVQNVLSTYSARIKYDSVQDAEFDKLSNVLSTEELSNYEKHRDAWRRIIAEEKMKEEDVCMVVEDDMFLVPNCEKHLKTLIQQLSSTKMESVDFLTLSLSDVATPDTDPLVLFPLAKAGRVLPSKEAYIVHPRICKLLLEQTETIRFSMRVHLSWIIASQTQIRAMYPSHRIFLDGSKLGLYPSTLHHNNMLVYNQEYMELFAYMSKSGSEIPIDKVNETWKKIAHIQNPDLMHLVGVLYFKAGLYREAEEMLQKAATEMQKQGGVLNNRSDLLNNLVNMYEKLQIDLPNIMAQPSKYAIKRS